jgi:hypothetical protein
MDKRIVDLLSTVHAEASFLLLADKEYCGGDFVLESCAGCACFFACESITRGNKILRELRGELGEKNTEMNKEVFETKCQQAMDWAKAEVRHFAEFAETKEDRDRSQQFINDINDIEPYMRASYEMMQVMKKMVAEYRMVQDFLEKKVPGMQKTFGFHKTCEEAETLLEKLEK